MADTMKVVNGLRFVMEEVHRDAMSMEDSKPILNGLLDKFYQEEKEERINSYRELVQRAADVEDIAIGIKWILENMVDNPELGLRQPEKIYSELVDLNNAVSRLENSIAEVNESESEGQL